MSDVHEGQPAAERDWGSDESRGRVLEPKRPRGSRPRAALIQTVLTSWRAAERKLQSVRDHERSALEAEVAALREEYRRLTNEGGPGG